VNQVHFYPTEKCGYSNARTYATVAYMDDLALELSIVSDDLPVMRAFCSKSSGDDVVIGQDRTKMFLSDPKSGSIISFSRISCNKPSLQVLPDDGYGVEFEVDRSQLVKALQWANMAREGTRRVSFKMSDGSMTMSCNGQEVSSLPISFLSGDSMSADFPADILAGVISYTESEKILFRFQHKILEICDTKKLGVKVFSVRSRHFLQAMKERGT